MTYRERRLNRAERLRDWAEKREAKSASAFQSARRIADGIPFGQPILVGHHSERHHRADIARIDSGMRRGIEHQDMAQSMNSRAYEIDRQADHAIYRDDPDAIERLTEKIAGLEAKREQIKAKNAAFRKAHKAELAAMPSAYERDQAMPHQAYELQNLGGNISRERERLADLQAAVTPRGSATVNETAETATARAGLTITATQTTPAKSWKKPRPVWNVSGNLAFWRPLLESIGGSWYHGIVSFWEDPTADIETAVLEAESKA